MFSLLAIAVIVAVVAIIANLVLSQKSSPRRSKAGKRNLNNREKKLLKQSKSLFKKKNFIGAAQILESINMVEEGVAILEKMENFEEAGKLALRTGMHRRAGYLFAKSKNWELAASSFVQGNMFLEAGQCYREIGDPQSALECFKQANDFRLIAKSYTELKEYRKAGMTYIKHKKVGKAIPLYQKMYEEDQNRWSKTDFTPAEIKAFTSWIKGGNPDLIFAWTLYHAKKLAPLILELLEEGDTELAKKIFVTDQNEMESSLAGQLVAEVRYETEQAPRLAQILASVGQHHYEGIVHEKLENFKEAAGAFRHAGEVTRAIHCYQRAGMREEAKQLETLESNAVRSLANKVLSQKKASQQMEQGNVGQSFALDNVSHMSDIEPLMGSHAFATEENTKVIPEDEQSKAVDSAIAEAASKTNENEIPAQLEEVKLTSPFEDSNSDPFGGNQVTSEGEQASLITPTDLFNPVAANAEGASSEAASSAEAMERTENNSKKMASEDNLNYLRDFQLDRAEPKNSSQNNDAKLNKQQAEQNGLFSTEQISEPKQEQPDLFSTEQTSEPKQEQPDIFSAEQTSEPKQEQPDLNPKQADSIDSKQIDDTDKQKIDGFKLDQDNDIGQKQAFNFKILEASEANPENSSDSDFSPVAEQELSQSSHFVEQHHAAKMEANHLESEQDNSNFSSDLSPGLGESHKDSDFAGSNDYDKPLSSSTAEPHESKSGAKRPIESNAEENLAHEHQDAGDSLASEDPLSDIFSSFGGDIAVTQSASVSDSEKQAFNSSWLLKSISPSAKDRVWQHGYTERLQKNDSIMTLQDHPLGVYIILSGTMVCESEGGSSEATPLAAGNSFGETSVFASQTLSATYTATEESLIYKISAAKLKGLMQDDHSMARQLFINFTDHLLSSPPHLKIVQKNQYNS